MDFVVVVFKEYISVYFAWLPDLEILTDSSVVIPTTAQKKKNSLSLT